MSIRRSRSFKALSSSKSDTMAAIPFLARVGTHPRGTLLNRCWRLASFGEPPLIHLFQSAFSLALDARSQASAAATAVTAAVATFSVEYSPAVNTDATNWRTRDMPSSSCREGAASIDSFLLAPIALILMSM